MPEKFNDRWEDNLKKVVPEAINSVKKDLEPVLEDYRKAGSVVNDSVNILESADSPNPIESTNGSAEQKNKVLVRTMKPSNGQGPVYPVNNSTDNNYNYSSSEYFENGSQQNSTLGSVSTLILILTAILVVLVVIVSLFIINSMGI